MALQATSRPTGVKETNSPLTDTCSNCSCKDLQHYMVLTEAEKMAIGPICFLAGPVTLLENVLVLGLIATTATLRQRPSYLFIGSLAVADVFASCFFPISFIEFHLFSHCDTATAYLFKLGGVIMAFSSSVGSLLLTALDRYLCIQQASSYKVLLTRRRALLSLLILWSVTIFISFLPLMGWRCPMELDPPCSQLFPYINHNYQACWIVFILVLLALILWAYAVILWKAHRHESSMVSLQESTGKGHARMRMDIRLARTFGLIVLIMVSCWLPTLSLMLADISYRLSRNEKRAFAFCSTLCLVNSAVNPLLYALRCRELRVSLLKHVQRLCGPGRCKRSTEDLSLGLPSAEPPECTAVSEDEIPRVSTIPLESISEAVNNKQQYIKE
ncbi:cannabinoid receptor 2 [Pholidichthys leucotaenia]